MNYTERQQKAIETQSGTVLVSAAAGSGKTSVLARRVALLIENGADIRNMLVVTFTNAAAAEMRRRIAAGLFGAAKARDDKRLMEQSELASAADISTFHSFCAGVVRAHYNIAGVSPDFRIMSEPEADALKAKTARELFDLLYETRDADFSRLLDRFTARANDAQLAAQMLRVYDRMMGQPQPFAWAERAARMDAGLYTAILKKEYEAGMAARLGDALALMELALSAARGIDTRQADADEGVAEELRRMAETAQKRGVAATRAGFAGFKIPALLPRGSEQLKEAVSDLRSEARKCVKAFLNDARYENFEREAKGEMEHTRPDALALVGLCRIFEKMYKTAKRRENALDYEDLQHLALAVLARQGGAYRKKYRYIFVDEYQDTNPVQEEIVRAVCGEENSLFMVGDVKQSIYKFRLADPGIFRQKAAEFRRGGGGEVVVMNDNFRSAACVIDAVNFVMDCVMSERLGEIEYAGDEKLVGNAEGGEAGVLLCEVGEGESSHHRAQAEMIAAHIAGLLGAPRKDRQGGEQKIAPGDIAVLVRSRSELTGELRRALLARGVPCAVSMKETKDLPEAELFVNVLRVVQNPARDIPLLSVMRALGGFDEADFTEIRVAANAEDSFYTAARQYRQQKTDALAGRLGAFFDWVDGLRLRSEADSLRRFLPWLAEELDFETWLMGRAGGNAKREFFLELMRRLDEAAQNAGGSLYLLLRELDEAKRRGGGYVQAPGAASRADCVRVMTIHGSKGLEFPVVYVAGLNKKFNTGDINEDFLLSGKYGVAAAYVDEAAREKFETLERAVWKEQIAAENRSEELRMLYVAMTRAEERLYLTGYVKGAGKEREKWRQLSGRYERAGCMLDWVMAANEGKNGLPVTFLSAGEGKRQADAFDFEEYRKKAREAAPAQLIRMPAVPAVPAKVSVSAVKQAQKGEGVQSFLSPRADEDAGITGAHLGTLVHGVMERVILDGDVDRVAAELLQNEIITDEEYAALVQNRWMAEGFLKTELCQRMRAAEKVLFEQEFNLRVPADEIGYAPGAEMLVQGILDAAFLEGGQWVLLDYKTDRVDGQTVARAAEGYRVQLDLYARSLTEITGIPVKQKYLYFLRLGREVLV